MIIVEGRRGLPLGELLTSGNREEKSTLEELLSQGMGTLAKPDNLLGDSNFSSRPLSQRLWKKYHIHFTAPPKRHYVNFFHDGRRLRRIKRRWKVERCFSWLKYHRRIETRWDIKAEHYLGFVQLACVMILIKHLF